ncbi:flagellar basal-body MS-ring/collar protein FliF [Sulfurospirillum sp. hDNRA2]|uniref:flagellar basal-body MS-ring/collar protein FliF n=1 Tax=Sulfurospirillum sp. hDNRA2 TaxID=3237298 RepID=UPI0020B652F6|nr:flagellar basal-body MS-ring/collar protein FliF [Sulfurospirillum sp. DNRA8]MCP3652304.1 flagellar M-ring protein FliF [Sulfurospirillum sp. DNRA8]MCR1811154.1 flagellar M-ring protein FliF [Sulfurospirillum sp. DNRA8]
MEFRTLLNQIATLIQNLTLRQRIVAAMSIVVLIGFLVFLMLYKNSNSSNTSGYSVLFENTTAGDSALIIQQLEKDKVPYKILNEGTIAVPSEMVHKQRIAIAAQGIPKNSKVGFEIFDKTEFGATDFEQKIKYIRALEGELARTIESLGPIANASVHIAVPKETVFAQKQASPTASVVLNIRSGMSLSLKQITGIKNLIAASIANLTAENVSIVNQDGEPLGDNDSNLFQGELVKSQIRYKKEFEHNIEQKIINVLAPVIGGIDKVNAKVTIDFDFSQQDSVSEIYDPNSVPRSEQSIEEKREGKEPQDVGGVPGAISNIGPVQGLESTKKGETYQKSSTTTNYEISKKVVNSKDEFAKIKRITAAVVVDGAYKYGLDEKGNKKSELEYTPLSKEQMDAIRDIVRQTVGYNATRGDEVTVSNFEFKPLSSDGTRVATKDFMDKVSRYVTPLVPLLKYLMVAILLFVFYKKVILPFSQKMVETKLDDFEDEVEPIKLDEEEGAEDTLEKFKQARKKVEDQLGIGQDFNEESLKYDVLLEKLKHLAEQKSEEFASLLQSMIRNEGDFDTRNSSKDLG